MDRRGFIGSILAAATAPAIVRADSLMRIVPRDMDVWIGAYHPLLNGTRVRTNSLYTNAEINRIANEILEHHIRTSREFLRQ